MDEFEQYIEDVLNGDVNTCKYVRLAVLRHLDDLERTDIYFDKRAAQYAMDFFSLLNLNTNPNDFKPFILSPFQKFIVGSIFGWKKAKNGFRRYNRAYIEVARKNGKTFFSAGISLLMMLADGERSPQIYTGANSKGQAYICFKDAVNMVKSSPALLTEMKIREYDMRTRDLTLDGVYKYLSADAAKHDGLRPHCVILDEIHEYKTNKLHGIFASAMVNRTQPLILMITTAGFNKIYWCYRDQRKFAIETLQKEVEADNLFAIIYTLDAGDDWKDPANWIKANPNLGVSLDEDALAQEIRTAMVKPEDRINILTKNLNLWEDSPTFFIEGERWDAAKRPMTDLDLIANSEKAYIGADLSYSLDITAYTIAFKLFDGNIYLKHRFFVPYGTAERRQEASGIPYMSWINDGHLIPCSGEVIDYELVEKYILEDVERFDVLTAGFDPHNASHLMQRLNRSLDKLYVKTADDKNYTQISPCYAIHQGFGTISPMIDLFEGSLYTEPKKLSHDGNPVMRWMLMNSVIVKNDDGKRKVSRNRSTEKIDGVISSLLAVEQLSYWDDKEIRKGSVYEKQNLRVL